MQTYHVKLETPVFTTFRCQRAANSLDIDTKKKSLHELTITADLQRDFNIGLILGSSGSGKTTLAKSIFGENCFDSPLKMDQPIIEQLPKDWSYDECAASLHGIGLTSVPQWIKSVYTLSNGQRARAEAVLLMSDPAKEISVIDEWTSVVDRTVAKAMSFTIQKYARKTKRKIILLSCHYDVTEWLDPDWIIDCNRAEFIDRGSLRPDERKRCETLSFDLKQVDRETWRYFSKYHYLSDRLPGGKIETYGLFHEGNQIGFQCFANYVPRRAGKPWQMHSNRTVIHPDYAGLGLGMKVINLSSLHMVQKYGDQVDVRAKFSSEPVYKAMIRDPLWHLESIDRKIGRTKTGLNFGRNMGHIANNPNTNGGFRENIKTYSFRFLGKINEINGVA